jgi:peptidoglycan hydrolase-like protein with peptidoglycan-binding domain
MPDWLPRDIISPANPEERRAVRIAQRKLGLKPSGSMGEATRAALRGCQRWAGLPVTGDLDRATAAFLERFRPVAEDEGEPE